MATLALFVILMIVGSGIPHSEEYASMESKDIFNSSTGISASHRKLLQQGEAAGGRMKQTNRIWGDRSCSSDIVINQGPTSPMPNGIPTYTVEITNVCVSGCAISEIHLRCGWFSSARLINPRIFKRLRYDNCLVNDGQPLLSGRAISFTYANTFPYALSVASVKC